MKTISGSSAHRNHPAAPARLPRRKPDVRGWNRRLHYYIGLYFLLFTWLFALSGLMLNHSKWTISHFWAERQETTVDRPIERPAASGDLAIARDLMRQLGIEGEIGTMKRDGANEHFDFQVVKPGQVWQVTAELAGGRASIKKIRLNAFGVFDSLHKLTGVRMDDAGLHRDWIWTRMWIVAMDALVIGWIVLVITGLYLWYRLRKKRLTGLVALGLGVASCIYFVLGVAAR